MDNHLFYAVSDLMVDDQAVHKYLGVENDLSLSYVPNDYTKVNLGFSWMLAQESMEQVKRGGNSNKTPHWSYIEVTFTPDLFKWSANNTQ